ncbi:SDR family NAD(P)-dependent oxidoreductase [Blastopirellula marina]|uniref:Oxidoreductase n=1 Tax=Blastopirellula marina TaxID=124 RepID=A0A2S8GP67_9BACT|nr:SDR family oxidoreductase [Blastopirellula marina]PQO46219.1 oxidoreductase [Blastopirellula marina]
MTQREFEGQVVLVTGSSQGIGRSAAVEFARRGANVVVNYHSNPAKAEEVVDEIEKLGGKAIAVKCDVSDYDAVEAMVAKTVETFGKLDIAVSNAVYSDREFFYEADLDGFRRTIDVTMFGAFHLLRAASRQLIAQKTPGAITIISSPHAFIPAPKAMAYNMSKAAIEHMAKTAAIELSDFRIRVNIVQPGWTDTPGERKFATDDVLEEGGSKIPFGRLGTPEEMAEAIAFMSSPKNGYTTGATLLVDGGISLPWWGKTGRAAPS